ncbi:DKNYY domain-containing protein [Pontibacter ummariensis]|nr:DKNYY domain-containing protein [Pontibacter ummariensis]
MKKSIAISLLSFILFGCEQEYIVKDNKVFLKGWNEGSGSYERLIEEADAKTFQTIDTDENLTLGKDNNHVYIESTLIENFDPKTLKYIGNYYFVDSDSAYFFGFYSNIDDCEIIGADPKSLKTFDKFPWAYDKNHIIYGHTIVAIDDLSDFEIISENWGRTKDKIIYKGRTLHGVDIKTFEIVDEYMAKDKYHTYEYGEIKT